MATVPQAHKNQDSIKKACRLGCAMQQGGDEHHKSEHGLDRLMHQGDKGYRNANVSGGHARLGRLMGQR
jgi:hypothetical protein